MPLPVAHSLPPATTPPRIAPPHQHQQTVLEDRWPATSERPPHNISTTKMPQRIHTSPGPAQTPPTPPPPPTAATVQSKPRSGPHYGTEFFMVVVLGPLFRTAGHTVRTQHCETAIAGQRRCDVEIHSFLPDQAGSRSLVFDTASAQVPTYIRMVCYRGRACAPAASQVCVCAPTPLRTHTGSWCALFSNHWGLKTLFKSLPSKIVGTGVCLVWWYEKFFVLHAQLVVV
jgi:hypothetical protein